MVNRIIVKQRLVKQRLVKQRLEFSTFLHFNLVKVYACNSISNENYVPANTMCTQAPPQSRARPALKNKHLI